MSATVDDDISISSNVNVNGQSTVHTVVEDPCCGVKVEQASTGAPSGLQDTQNLVVIANNAVSKVIIIFRKPRGSYRSWSEM